MAFWVALFLMLVLVFRSLHLEKTGQKPCQEQKGALGDQLSAINPPKRRLFFLSPKNVGYLPCMAIGIAKHVDALVLTAFSQHFNSHEILSQRSAPNHQQFLSRFQG